MIAAERTDVRLAPIMAEFGRQPTLGEGPYKSRGWGPREPRAVLLAIDCFLTVGLIAIVVFI
jgi:hypothetical protein